MCKYDEYNPFYDTTTGMMQRYGGSFVQALAEAWIRADAGNLKKLHVAFGDIWDRYHKMLIQERINYTKYMNSKPLSGLDQEGSVLK